MAILPAVNTPQFSWCRSKLPRKAQPVPPIFQPEVIARGIVWLARHRRRELVIGGSALKALVGQNLAPGLVDRILAKTGYDAQQYDGENPPGRPDNLMAPLPGDWGAHGDFDARSRTFSAQLWFTTHRSQVALAAGIAAVLGVRAFVRGRG